jgi:hypothetical protein
MDARLLLQLSHALCSPLPSPPRLLLQYCMDIQPRTPYPALLGRSSSLSLSPLVCMRTNMGDGYRTKVNLNWYFDCNLDKELESIISSIVLYSKNADCDRSMQMMSNLDLVRMATESMNNMRTEDFKRAAEQMRQTRPEDMAQITDQMAKAKPEEIAAMKARADAQLNYEISAAKLLKQEVYFFFCFFYLCFNQNSVSRLKLFHAVGLHR